MGLTRVNSQDVTDGQIKQIDLGVLSGKGSLVSYNGSNHIEFVTGQSGYMLVADPSTTAGLNWITPGSTGPIFGNDAEFTGNYTVQASDYVVIHTGHNYTGEVFVTLPLTTTCTGRIIIVNNASTGNSGLVTITGAGGNSEYVGNALEYGLAPGERVSLLNRGGNRWSVIAETTLNYNNVVSRRGLPATQIMRTSPSNGTALSTAVMVANRTYAMPYVVDRVQTLTGMAIAVSTTGTAGGYFKCAIYNDSGGGTPGSIMTTALGGLAQTNELPNNVAAVTTRGFTDGSEVVLTKGQYWLMCATTGASTPGTLRGFAIGGLYPIGGYTNAATPLAVLGYNILSTVSSGANFVIDFPTNITAMTAAPLPALFVLPK